MPWIDSETGQELDPKLFATPAPGAAPSPTPAKQPSQLIDAETGQPLDPNATKLLPIPPGMEPASSTPLAQIPRSGFQQVAGLLDQPQLGPFGQRMQNWINRQTAQLPQSVRPYLETTQTPAEKAAELASIVGTMGEAIPGSQPYTIPLRYGLPLAAAGVGGYMEAPPGRGMETAGQEMLKTGLGLVPSAFVGGLTGAPIIRSIPGVQRLGQAAAAGLRTQAGPIGRQVETQPMWTGTEAMMITSLAGVAERVRELFRGLPAPGGD